MKKKAIQEAQHKVDMITYLAHDIKTPLTSVIGYLCLLDESKDMSQKQSQQYAHMALQKAYRLENMMNEFFEIAKLNQGHVPLQKENINLCYLFEQMREEFYPIVSQKDQYIDIQIDEKLQIYADSQKIARVFNNILKNAYHYGDEKTQITVEAKEDDLYTNVWISNIGETIPEDKLQCIFEQFYRLDASRSSFTGGAGLGLSIAKLIVEQHYGIIRVESHHHKTIFEVRIPKKDILRKY